MAVGSSRVAISGKYTVDKAQARASAVNWVCQHAGFLGGSAGEVHLLIFRCETDLNDDGNMHQQTRPRHAGGKRPRARPHPETITKTGPAIRWSARWRVCPRRTCPREEVWNAKQDPLRFHDSFCFAGKAIF